MNIGPGPLEYLKAFALVFLAGLLCGIGLVWSRPASDLRRFRPYE